MLNILYRLSTADSQTTLPGLARLFISRRIGPVALALVFWAIVIYCPQAYCLDKQSPKAGASDCHHSDQMHDSDQALMLLRESPTHLRLMTGRYVAMVQAVRGYQCTGTVAVSFDGHHYLQTGGGDDPGILELIPTLSRLAGLPLVPAYDITVASVIAAGLFIGYAGFWKLYAERHLRWLGGGVFVCLGLAEARVADEYMFQISPLVAAIPWLIYFALRRKRFSLTTSAVLLAFCCSWCSLVRAGTMSICMTLLITMFVFRRCIQSPFIPCLLMILALLPSVIFEQSLIARRDAALARAGGSAIAQDSHLLWHTVYIGLGFIHNSEVSEYLDAVAADKVRAIDPTAVYTSPKYELILRHEVWSIIKRKPMLVAGIVAAKAGIVTLLGMILLYPIRWLLFTEGELVWLDAALLLTMGMSALNAIVAVPRASYLLTFLCLGFLFSAIKLSRARLQSDGWSAESTPPRDETEAVSAQSNLTELLRGRRTRPQTKHPTGSEG